MIDKERLLYEARVDVFIKRLKTLFYREERSLQVDYCVFDPMVPFDERTKGHYKPIHVGEAWGNDWDRAWFHLQGVVPKEWAGQNVIARINLGGEALVFDSDGVPVCGLSVHTIWQPDEFVRDRLPITSFARGGEQVDLWIEATAAELFGLKLEMDRGTYRPEVYGKLTAAVRNIELMIFEKKIWDLYLDCHVLYDQMKALPVKNVRRARILRALMRAIDCFRDDDPSSILRGRELLKTELEKKSAPSDLTTIAVGHSHIDTAWLWPVEETIRKCGRTFANQIQLMEIYPGFIFGASQAQHYAFVKAHYPGLYEKIRQKITEGRWEVQGGMWVEADCNLSSGESLVRQILHGKIFYQDEFGVEVKNLWLPDVFGYSAALPQILKKSGIDFFITQKLSWNQLNRFPHHTFIWRGIDGSEVIAHFPPEDNYNSDLRPSALIHGRENFDEHAYLDEFLTLFGIGDGGCGPTEEMIETGLRCNDMEGSPRVRFGRAQDFLDRLAHLRSLLPRWIGELYLEMHRGTLTTQAYNKKMNRTMELKLRELEIIYSLLPLEHYPAKELDSMWKRVLLNQFHDIIPGSSITQVYDKTRQDYTLLMKEARQLLDRAADGMGVKNDRALTFFNSLSCEFSGLVDLPTSWHAHTVKDREGNRVDVQQEKSTSIASIKIPALGSVTIHRDEKKREEEERIMPQCMILENEYILYEFEEQGRLKRAYDKEARREIIPVKQFGNVLSLYEDRPSNWDAWEIDRWYEDQLIEVAALSSQEWVSYGTIRQGIEQKFKIDRSTIVQNIYLSYNSKRLDFETSVEWNESHRMLRVAFTVDIHADTATYEIQYGHVKRNTHRNTSWDMAKFEVVGHRFADLSEPDYGVALLNDCKYGYKILENVIDLNLLRSPTMPDPFADQGHHEFTYSLLPHMGDCIHSNVLSEALQLNQKPACFIGYEGNGVKMPFRLDSDEIVIEVIKKAEKDLAHIVRLYEPKGRRTVVNFHVDLPVAEVDLLEREIAALTPKKGVVKLSFKPFEIKTLKIKKQ